MLALGSDAPTAPYAPLSSLYCATTRRSARQPESLAKINEQTRSRLLLQCLRLRKALRTHVLPMRGLKVDFTVIDMNWTSEDLLKAQVYQTWFEGWKVYDRDDEGR